MDTTSHNNQCALVLDIGTTGVKAFVFDSEFAVIAKTYAPLTKSYPQERWVELDPKELLNVSKNVLQEAVRASGISGDFFVGLGVATQRETTVLWDKQDGMPVYPAIAWEDARTKKECAAWKSEFNETIRNSTGLTIDPYFSASKIAWILKNVPEAKILSDSDDLMFGTIDTWFLWNCMENNPHVTDYTNASRTLLFNIKTLDWDSELLEIFGIPPEILPSPQPSQHVFGNLKEDILGFSLPVITVCGDQQASLYAAGKEMGTTKATFGTGSFVMQNIGPDFSLVEPFFTTLTANKKQPDYALEAKVDFYGEQVQPVLSDPRAFKAMLTEVAKKVDVYLKKLPLPITNLVLDGGVARNGKLSPIQSNISGIPVSDQIMYDGTALGIAKMLFDQ